MMMTIYIVLTQLPDRLSAEKLARGVIQERLAACVTQMPAVTSIYTWQGVVEQTEEFPLLFKTTQHQYAELEAYIISHHPYEVPEILVNEKTQKGALKALNNMLAI